MALGSCKERCDTWFLTVAHVLWTWSFRAGQGLGGQRAWHHGEEASDLSVPRLGLTEHLLRAIKSPAFVDLKSSDRQTSEIDVCQ